LKLKSESSTEEGYRKWLLNDLKSARRWLRPVEFGGSDGAAEPASLQDLADGSGNQPSL